MKKKLLTLFTLCLALSVSLFVISACNEVDAYNVTFKADGNVYSVVEVDSGKTVSKPQNPTKTGYTFAGWYNGNDVWSFDSAVDGDLTLEAKFNPTNYSINYDLVGGSVATANPNGYTIESETITLNNPTKEYYDFAGWTYAGQEVPKLNVKIEKGSTGNKSFAAKYVPVDFTITYNYNDSIAPSDNPEKYNIESESFTLKNPTKANANFIGWSYVDGEGQTQTKLVVTIDKGTTGNLEFTAVFEACYNINYVLDGGHVSGNPTTVSPNYPTFTLNNPVKKDYVFVGWTYEGQTTSTKTVTINKGEGNKEYTFTANYEKALIVSGGELTGVHQDVKSATTINITSDVTSIAANAFDGCIAVTSFTSDSASFKVINGNLYSADGAKLIKYAVAKEAVDFILPDTVTEICSNAFNGATNLTELELPARVTTVKVDAFKNCGNLVVTISSRKQAVGYPANWETDVKDVIVVGASSGDVEVEF